jgi:hypothetical protein
MLKKKNTNLFLLGLEEHRPGQLSLNPNDHDRQPEWGRRSNSCTRPRKFGGVAIRLSRTIEGGEFAISHLSYPVRLQSSAPSDRSRSQGSQPCHRPGALLCPETAWFNGGDLLPSFCCIGVNFFRILCRTKRSSTTGNLHATADKFSLDFEKMK